MHKQSLQSSYKVSGTRIRDFVEANQILSENRLGTVRNCQGAKEQALIYRNLSLYHENDLSTMWIDVKKAYDSVNHEYLIECLVRLNIPSWCIKFVKSLTDNWKINLNYNKKVIANIGLERGILQGDSLSPLLFVSCMEPLGRKLNISHETVRIEEGSDWFRTNHLIFIDDIKLFAKSEEVLKELSNTTRNFLDIVGLEVNQSKSATNAESCRGVAKFLEEHELQKES